jgi:hypothetical protein
LELFAIFAFIASAIPRSASAVLVDQCCPDRVMPHALHEIFEARAGARSDRVAGVPEIMEVQAREADLSRALVPLGRPPGS